jgi:mRNA interferase MazF
MPGGATASADFPAGLRNGVRDRLPAMAETDAPPEPLPPPKGPEPEIRPPRVQPRIIAAPKLGQVYWCDFWQDAQLPEMWKTRPVVVMSYKNALHGPCLVIPITTKPQEGNPWACKLPSGLVESQESWAVCNHLYTVAPSRLSQVRSKIPKLSGRTLNEIRERMMKWLPRPFEEP